MTFPFFDQPQDDTRRVPERESLAESFGESFLFLGLVLAVKLRHSHEDVFHEASSGASEPTTGFGQK